MPDTAQQVSRYWNDAAAAFDSIYTGRKSGVARSLDHLLRRDMYDRFDWVMDRAGDATGKRVCDVGCGSGRFVTELARRGASKVTGIDVAPAMLELARKLAQQDRVADRCEFIETDVLDFRSNERFDFTIAIGLWDYIPDPLPRLKVIRSFTEGTFLSAWPRRWTWRMPVRKVRLSALGCPVYFYHKSEAQKYLRQAGFEVVSTRILGQLYCIEARSDQN